MRRKLLFPPDKESPTPADRSTLYAGGSGSTAVTIYSCIQVGSKHLHARMRLLNKFTVYKIIHTVMYSSSVIYVLRVFTSKRGEMEAGHHACDERKVLQ